MLTSLLVGFVEDPTVDNPNPDQFLPGRITLWAIFVLLTLGYSYRAYLARIPLGQRSNDDSRGNSSRVPVRSPPGDCPPPAPG